MMQKNRLRTLLSITTIFFASLILTLVLCAMLWLLGATILLPSEEKIAFSVEGWNAPMTDSSGIFTGTRLKMVDDLLKRYDFHGRSMNEIQKLLGKPNRDEMEGQKHLKMYDLRDDLNFLIFQVNDEEKVVDYYVRRE